MHLTKYYKDSYNRLLLAFKLIKFSHDFNRDYYYSVKHHRKKSIKPQCPPPKTKETWGEMSFTWIWWMAACSTSQFTLKVNYFLWYYRHKLKPWSFSSHTYKRDRESNHLLDVKASCWTGWSKSTEQRHCRYMQWVCQEKIILGTVL